VLEGQQKFVNRFVIAPPEHTTPSGGLSTKKETKEWMATLADSEIVSVAEMEKCHAMRAAVFADKTAALLLSEGKPEVETFTHKWGAAVKGKADWYDRARGRVIDLKTIGNIEDIESHCWDFGYDRQLAWYMDLFECDDHAVVFVEKEPPHRVVVVKFCAKTISEARNKNIETLMEIERCREKDSWDNGIKVLSRP